MSFEPGSNYEDGQFDYNALYWLLKNRKKNFVLLIHVFNVRYQQKIIDTWKSMS